MTAALVTGASGTIGVEIVRALVADGVRVAAVDLVDPTPHFADLVASGSVVAVVADIAQSDDRARAIGEAHAGVGPIRYLVNDAADCSELSLLASTDEHWRSILETNLIAPAALVRLLADDLRASAGVVINMSSVRGIGTLTGAAAYEASKAALLSLTRTIAAELGPYGVRAVSVCPGAIVQDPDTWLDGAAAGYREAWTAAQPQGRVGTPTQIADVVAFLCNDKAAHVSGVELVVDGGVLAQYPATAALRMGGQIEAP